MSGKAQLGGGKKEKNLSQILIKIDTVMLIPTK